MKKILLIFLFASIKQVKAQSYVYISDANFVSYLHSLIPAAMNGDSMDSSSPLVTTFTDTIDVKGQGIANIDGVQYFTSLIYLNCSQNSLASLPALPSSLQNLHCGNNSLTSLPVLPVTLVQLYCDTNQLPGIPALPNTLKYLSCGFNQLISLPTLPGSILSLYCCANNLTSLPTLPSSIYYVNCTVNSLNSLPASLPNSILYLYLGDNNLSGLPSLPNSLKRLWCDYNYLTNIPVLPGTLQYFYCYHNSLTSLPALPNSLKYFDCSSNNISCFPAFPGSIISINIDTNPYNCLPNYIPAMSAATLTNPICGAGNSNGCPDVTGIQQQSAGNDFGVAVYPNPTSGRFTLDSHNSVMQTIQLFDLNGKLLLTQHVNGTTTIDAAVLDEGIYNLTINTEVGAIKKKLVIVR